MRGLMRQNILQGFIAYCDDEPTPGAYLERMKKSGQFADNLFLMVMAAVLKSDIILLHVNEATAANGKYTYIYGGGILSETPSDKCPLFLGFYEESIYASGHYQSVIPCSDNQILRDIVNKGGFDVTAFHQLPEGKFILANI